MTEAQLDRFIAQDTGMKAIQELRLHNANLINIYLFLVLKHVYPIPSTKHYHQERY